MFSNLCIPQIILELCTCFSNTNVCLNFDKIVLVNFHYFQVMDLNEILRENNTKLEKLEYENLEIKDCLEKERESVKICLECEMLKDKVNNLFSDYNLQ